MQQFVCDAVQGKDFFGAAMLDGFFGHSVHHAGRFVLRNGSGASIAQAAQSPRSVVAHAGQDCRRNVFARLNRAGIKENIHGRAVMIYGRRVENADGVFRAGTLEFYVEISRRNEGVTGQNAVAII